LLPNTYHGIFFWMCIFRMAQTIKHNTFTRLKYNHYEDSYRRF